MEDTKKMLDEELQMEFNDLAQLEGGTEEKSQAIDDIVKLYRLKIDETKVQNDFDDKYAMCALKEQDQKDSKHFETIKFGCEIGLAAFTVVIGIIEFYSGLRFEKTGTPTSKFWSKTFGNIGKTYKR